MIPSKHPYAQGNIKHGDFISFTFAERVGVETQLDINFSSFEHNSRDNNSAIMTSANLPTAFVNMHVASFISMFPREYFRSVLLSTYRINSGKFSETTTVLLCNLFVNNEKLNRGPPVLANTRLHFCDQLPPFLQISLGALQDSLTICATNCMKPSFGPLFFALAPHLLLLTRLDITGLSPIHAEDAQVLAQYIACSTTLREFRAVLCGITSACCGFLATGITRNKSLKSLFLSQNSIGDEGVSLLAPALASASDHLLNVSLSSCNISEKGGKCLAKHLGRKGSPLSTLDLTSNLFSEYNHFDCIEEFVPVALVGSGGVGAKSAMVIKFLQVFHT